MVKLTKCGRVNTMNIFSKMFSKINWDKFAWIVYTSRQWHLFFIVFNLIMLSCHCLILIFGHGTMANAILMPVHTVCGIILSYDLPKKTISYKLSMNYLIAEGFVTVEINELTDEKFEIVIWIKNRCQIPIDYIPDNGGGKIKNKITGDFVSVDDLVKRGICKINYKKSF